MYVAQSEDASRREGIRPKGIPSFHFQNVALAIPLERKYLSPSRLLIGQAEEMIRSITEECE